jgi:hypothetical protein
MRLVRKGVKNKLALGLYELFGYYIENFIVAICQGATDLFELPAMLHLVRCLTLSTETIGSRILHVSLPLL